MSNAESIGAKAEMSLMGMVMSVSSNEEAKEVANYITDVLETDKVNFDFLDSRTHPQVKAVVVNVLFGMRVITFAVTTDEDEGEFNLFDDRGCISYVANLTEPLFSEWGYCFFKRRNGVARRVG